MYHISGGGVPRLGLLKLIKYRIVGPIDCSHCHKERPSPGGGIRKTVWVMGMGQLQKQLFLRELKAKKYIRVLFFLCCCLRMCLDKKISRLIKKTTIYEKKFTQDKFNSICNFLYRWLS